MHDNMYNLIITPFISFRSFMFYYILTKTPPFLLKKVQITLFGSHFTFMLQYRKLKPKWYINLKCFNQARIPGPNFFVQLHCLKNKLKLNKKPQRLNQTHITRNDEVGKVTRK